MVTSGVRRQGPRRNEWRRRSDCVRSARGSLWFCGKPKRCRWQRTPKKANYVAAAGGDDLTWQRAKLKFIARFGYGGALPTDEAQEGPYRVFGSNGPYASFSRPNTGTPAIIVGRKGSYGKVNWTPKPCFASDTTFFIDSSMTRHDLRWVYWLLQTLRLDEGTDETAVPGLRVCPKTKSLKEKTLYRIRNKAKNYITG